MTKIQNILDNNETIACVLTETINNVGNSTKLILNCGKPIIIHKSVSSVLREIAEFYAIDLKLLRKKQQTYIHNKYYMPLPITKSLLLIPIKTKTPIVPKDPSISYINFYSIKEISSSKPYIYLNNGIKIKSLNSVDTIKKRYSQASICHRFMDSANSNTAYDYPVTKADLEKLKEEILHTQKCLIESIVRHKKNNQFS
ncbi:hypothetical protein [Serpentinicella alkaliphila]|uniref:ComK protein n=1 Tax=Serpentinicella alkaliphila TaxID=1734049 RepID=A0A4R2TH52_9FIRM|nr:hypothetical protein [Serpentinicella alkaliphila]QUH25018.1 hypothetical protein HZR23_03915 [Serpentinicella alkaliphila]TCQ02501.1 hypothetical protein EDD79_101518 [Serpentinicella alkaliphila]